MFGSIIQTFHGLEVPSEVVGVHIFLSKNWEDISAKPESGKIRSMTLLLELPAFLDREPAVQ